MGIQKLNPETETAALENFNKHKDSISWMKFVPASGAASRMFAPFFAFQKQKKHRILILKIFVKQEEGSSIKSLFNELKKTSILFHSLCQNCSRQCYFNRH